MLQRIETFELPAHVSDRLGRAMLALGVVAFASGLVGTLIA